MEQKPLEKVLTETQAIKREEELKDMRYEIVGNILDGKPTEDLMVRYEELSTYNSVGQTPQAPWYRIIL